MECIKRFLACISEDEERPPTHEGRAVNWEPTSRFNALYRAGMQHVLEEARCRVKYIKIEVVSVEDGRAQFRFLLENGDHESLVTLEHNALLSLAPGDTATIADMDRAFEIKTDMS